MRSSVFTFVVASVIVGSALARKDPAASIVIGQANSPMDSGWVVQIPTGPSDFFSVSYPVVPGIGNSEVVVDGLRVVGDCVSVADFGSGRTYARVGLYLPNVALDPSGLTPDLSTPVTEVTSPPIGSPSLFSWVWVEKPPAMIPSGTSRVIEAVQLPPGDPGLLGVGADSTTASSNSSGFSTDGYATPAIVVSFLDICMNPAFDNSTTTSCKAADREPHGRLRAESRPERISRDMITNTIKAGDTLGLKFFGTKPGDRFRFYFNVAPCTPAVALGPVLPTLPDGDGGGSYLALSATWPAGFGSQTFRFSAVWGNPGCSNPGVGFTNCVTIITRADPLFGVCDDGTVESGWVVQIPSGSSDYFNNSYGSPPGSVNGVVGLTVSVLDFGTSAPGYPTSGVSNANLVVDPTGNTPDVAHPLASVSPFTFPPGSFETTSGMYTSHAVSIAGTSLSNHIHGWVQFPPGDPGLLGVGGDTTASNGCSFFSLDGYSSPAISFFANWGIRIKTN